MQRIHVRRVPAYLETPSVLDFCLEMVSHLFMFDDCGTAWNNLGTVAFLPLCCFTSWLICPLCQADSFLGLFTPWLILTHTLDDFSSVSFAPCLICPLACSPPGLFTPDRFASQSITRDDSPSLNSICLM